MRAKADGASMREEELEVALKVVIVGDGGVGKSSMIQRYCRGTFTRDYKKTIGVDFLERQIEWVQLAIFLPEINKNRLVPSSNKNQQEIILYTI